MERILESISIARARGATVRVGPELEIPGYGCLDHFLEGEPPLFFFLDVVSCRVVSGRCAGFASCSWVRVEGDGDGDRYNLMQVIRCCIRGRCWRAYSPLTIPSAFSATSGCTCIFAYLVPIFYFLFFLRNNLLCERTNATFVVSLSSQPTSSCACVFHTCANCNCAGR
jgi:hypothetical protein